ncbi:MAG TPA: hypothetical protein DCM28_14310 [Phycisphaerales bacterium]|nr:hypothetical protein [Phycisphaerales bacterium]|tara:strand:+ start:740 stop:2746 length:2007 start_codon:yes stop_codon:yes gene_type:complete
MNKKLFTPFRFVQNVSVTWQLRFAMLVLMSLSVLIGITCFHILEQINGRTLEHINQQEYLVRPSTRIAIQTLQCRRYEKDMFLNVANSENFEAYFKRWTLTVDELIRDIITYREHSLDGQQVLSAEKWLASSLEYQLAVMNVVNHVREGIITTPAEANLALTPSKSSIRSLIVSSFNFFDHEFAKSRIASRNLQKQTQDSQQWISLCVLLVVVVSVIALITIPRRIVGPLRTLENAASRLRDGDFSARLSHDIPTNELGRLGLAFNEMAQHIQMREKELIEAKAQADSLNNAKTSFLMNMSHELRTPLTTIIGFTDLLEDQASREESIEAISRSSQHLLHIVDDLLQLTEIETNQLVLKGSFFRFSDIVNDLLEELKHKASFKNLELIIPEPQKLDIELYSDEHRLQSVLYQLLDNAIKFTQEGHVQIRCDMTDDLQKVLIEIKDTGIGMSAQQLKRSGELFFMGDASMTRERGGTGTGLALCQRTIECLEGKLSINSHPGKGTTVTITLPLKSGIPRETPSTDKQSLAVHQLQAGAGRNKVLVAEDTPEIQKLVKSLLENINIKVDVVGDGKAAVEMAMRSHLNDKPYDLVIMDMQMPVMDGYAATRQLRLQGYSYPVVALTAHAMEGDRQKCLDVGCDDYMKKPIDPAMFIRYVRHWLEHPLIRVI